MIKLESESLGYYELGFLHIKVKTFLSLNNLDETIKSESKIFSTFLHEYIHFLQNFTTTSGIYSSHFYTQFIKHTINTIKTNPNQEIKLPLKIDDSFNRNSLNMLNTIYLGETGFIRQKVIYRDYYSVEEKLTDKINNITIKPKKYFINFTNIEKYRDEKYHFGIIALKEYVAHKIQNRFHQIEHPDIPYIIAELILEKELPDLNDDLKILLCDASLMSTHPARFFFDSINKLQKTKDFQREPKEFYKNLFKDLKFKYPEGKVVDYKERFNDVYEELKYDYKNMFTGTLYVNELDWFLHILENAKNIRINNPTFILNLINKNGALTQDFKNIVEDLGTPFFINDLTEGGFVPPKNFNKKLSHIHILLSASQLLRAVYSKKPCAMYQYCDTNHEDGDNPTNEFCKTNPFLKLGEVKACSFSQLCKTWGIHKKKYIR